MSLNHNICDARTQEDILEVVETSCEHFNTVNIATALNRLGRLAARKSARLDEGVKALEMLLLQQRADFEERELITSLAGLAKTGTANPDTFLSIRAQTLTMLQSTVNQQGLSQLVWSYATARCHDNDVFAAASDRILTVVPQLSAQSLANIAWSYATVRHEDRELFRGIADCAAHKLSMFEPQHLTNLLWAFAKAGQPAPDLFERGAASAVRSIKRFTAQGLSNLAWSFATAGHHAPSLFDAIAREASGMRASDFNAQFIANTLWSFSKAGHSSHSLFLAMARQSLYRVKEFSPQHLANISWAFATAKLPQPHLFDTIAKQAVTKIQGFAPQGLSATAWAFASAQHNSPELVKAICSELLHNRKMTDFTPCCMAQLAWALATSGATSPKVFSALASASSPAVLAAMGPRAMSNLLWAFASAGHTAPALFDAAAIKAAPRAGDLTAQGLSIMAWSYATAQHPSPSLFDALAAEVPGRISEFSAQNLALMCWSYATLLHPEGKLLTQAAMGVVAAKAEVFDEQSLANILHASAMLGCLDSHFLNAICPRLECLHAAGDMRPEGYRTLFQCTLAMDLSSPEPQLSKELLAEARRYWLEGVEYVQESKLQREVLEMIQEMYPCQNEGKTPDGLFSVDVMVFVGEQQVAVEVDGPSHFSCTEPRQPLGATCFRRKMLESRCSAVMSIPFFEWNGKGEDERRAYIKGMLLPEE